jgi:hypothetical protein
MGGESLARRPPDFHAADARRPEVRGRGGAEGRGVAIVSAPSSRRSTILSEPPRTEPSKNGRGLELENLGGEQAPGTTTPRMLVPLFLVPLVIVGVIVAIFLGIGSLIGTEKSVEQWIAEVETGGVNERWQAAANLTDLATRQPEKLATPEIRQRLRSLFTVAGPEDTRLRQWVARLWTMLDDAESAPLCAEGLERMKEVLATEAGRSGPQGEPASLELIHYVRALGRIGNSSHEAAILSVAGDPDKAIRMAVTEALGSMGRRAVVGGGAASEAAVAALVGLHGDDDPWVRMNAALALAKCGRWEGVGTLEAMVDRDWLKEQKLAFPDDGNYSAHSFDPAAEPIASALLALEALAKQPAVESVQRATLREAVAKAARDRNPAIQERASRLLASLER